ncbi:MAG: cysteine synthase A [Fastidiosipilaceae bacterium]|jgi:cysteine synthase A
MSKIYRDVAELIGDTPLYEVSNIEKNDRLAARVLVKLESFNPAGSVKDRIAFAMVAKAEEDGLIKPGDTIIEPTSGNTGIGLAAIAASRGYRSIFVMPESMSVERRKILQGYGARIVLTPADQGMKGAIAKANELNNEIEDSFIPSQFENLVNPLAHEQTTGPEIWRDTDGEVAAFVSGIGTGGTVSGVSHYLKRQNQSIHIVAVEPSGSPVLSEGHGGAHKIQGIGAGFIPNTLDTQSYDEVITVADDDALRTSRRMAREEGVLVGISSGAALWAALELAKRPEFKDQTIVALLPDTGERYLSTALFEFES